MSSHESVHLGFEVGTGKGVEIPCRHMVVTGQTQEAGKTTTLEALISRSGLPAVAFVTKRGEQSFAGGRRIAPYFRERADWQFVASVLEATMRERLKFERSWIMRASKGAKSLADVQRNVQGLMKSSKGLSSDVYFSLNEYLEIVVPRVASVAWAESVDLEPGLNVLDLSNRDRFPSELQSLVMRSVLEWVYEKCNGTITIIPEAWEFIPQKRGSPVKLAAIELIRKGAGLRNYVWLDSQDIGGVEKELLRSCTVWLLGVQREANEISRTLDNIPLGIAKPKPADVATLERGQFFACWGRHVIKTYVQPDWMDSVEARTISLGGKQTTQPPKPERRPMGSEAELRRYFETEIAARDQLVKNVQRENEMLRDRLADLEKRSRAAEDGKHGSNRSDGGHKVVATTDSFDEEALYKRVLARLLKEPAVMELRRAKPEIRIEEYRETIDVSTETLRGRLASLIAKGFFNEPHNANQAFLELKRLGFKSAVPNVYKECDKLAELGFLTKEAGGYQAVPEMKTSIKKA